MMRRMQGIAALLLPCFLSGTHAFAPLASTYKCNSFCLSHQPVSPKLYRDDRIQVLSATTTRVVNDVSHPPNKTKEKGAESNEDATYYVAIRNTTFYILIAIAFGTLVWINDPSAGEEFFAGYIVEKSLSVDNLFVFLLLFDYFKVPEPYQGRILTWGIYGSLVMRAIMISLGSAALSNFHEILLVFAAILIYSADQVLYDVEDEDEEDLSANPVIRISQSLIPSTDVYDGDRFFTVEAGVKKATPLFICMVAVELSDLVFAVDSIPAVFGVTENPLIVYSSNMFAILGLRSIFPLLSKAATDLKYLEPAVAVILAFIGSKMIAEYYGYTLPTEVALAVIISLLGLGVGLSLHEKNMTNEEQKHEKSN
ncbi:hypothetical protein ACHAXR_002831 [Thalassiosira sp. AJA248-18]